MTDKMINILILSFVHTCISKHLTGMGPFWKMGPYHDIITSSLPKQWTVYLNKQLASTLSNHKYEIPCLSTCNIILWRSVFDRKTNCMKCRKREESNKLILTKICANRLPNIIPIRDNIGMETNFKSHKISVHLQHVFRINITIMELKLSKVQQSHPSKNLAHRLHEAQFIIEYLDILELCSDKSICAMTSYSGNYPIHSLYLLEQTTDILWATSFKLASSMTMIYQVIDTSLISYFRMNITHDENNIVGNSDKSITDIFINMNLFQGDLRIKCNIFRISVTRIYKTHLFARNKESFNVFDGPDLNVPEILPVCSSHKGCIYKSSTYQVTVAMYHTKQNESNLLTFKNSHVEANQVTHLSIMLLDTYESEAIKLPFDQCNEELAIFCVVQVKTTSILGINVSMSEMQYVGPTMLGDQCNYGGLVIYEWTSTHLEELALHCENTSELSYSLSVFSTFSTKEIWIVTSAYKVYGTISARILFTAAPCKSIMVQNKIYDRFGCIGIGQTRRQRVISLRQAQRMEWHLTFHRDKLLGNMIMKKTDLLTVVEETK